MVVVNYVRNEHPPATDLKRWRMKVEDGRQTWHYLTNDTDLKNWPQTAADQYWLGIYNEAPVLPTAKTPIEAARNGFEFYKELQTEDGHWAGKYDGPMFLIPGMVIAYYVTGVSWPEGYPEEIIRYLKNRAHPQDGGWGIHFESESTVFGTALNYLSLRLLGLPAEDPVCIKARKTLHRLGGALASPHWGKFWLSIMNLYQYEGMNPVPPELWLLPDWVPLHPGNWWCHCRAVYLPMGWLYAYRYKMDETDLIRELRKELYVEDYESIQWSKHRNNVCKLDLYNPHTVIMEQAFGLISMYEKYAASPSQYFRKWALDVSLEQIRGEDEATKYNDIGPVNKAMHMIIVWIVDGPNSKSFQKHLDRNLDFMWMGENGLNCNGTNGSQLWDASFAVQAMIEADLADDPKYRPYILKAMDFIDSMQIKTDPPNCNKIYRHISKGAWPFSTRDQSYTLSDCTAEALKSILLMRKYSWYNPKKISDDRLFDAVNILLSMQNSDGGFASYEKIRASNLMEWLNPAEVFANIMVEYNYPECTTAVVLGLASFRKHYPDHRTKEINKCITRAVEWIRKAQAEDGSWYGSWGVCFTYAMMFALESLASVGEFYQNSESVRKACDFLVGRQNADGGWGESYQASEIQHWVYHRESQVVNTAWAVITLTAAKYPIQSYISRGVKLIMQRQRPNGEWLQEAIEGVFNKNCMIAYPNYKFAFSIWALSRYAKVYGDHPIE
ncbi:terpenoid cyclases/protein prenyltransferase alpha-alpha toroid [Cladochytrium replicatum]|nr:terpenoid cyclases/protein prenyltransferase alpha-alpha toroid [Cladochytrium replicatum]